MKRVLVSAASSVVRAGLEALIRSSPALTLVGSAPGVTTEAFARQLADLRPDAALLDLDLAHGRNEATWNELLTLAASAEEAAADGPPFNTPVIIALADDMQGGRAVEALRAGVCALLPRSATGEEIIAAVEAAATGLITLDPSIMASLTAILVNVQRAEPNAPNGLTNALAEALTPREREVLSLLAEGLGNRALAVRLGISEHTVKFHVSSIFAKLGATSRTEAINLGIRRGLVLL